jgi:hypothetical protein
MDYPGKPPRAVWHTTESGAGDGAFSAVARVLIANGDEPHILYDPTTDRIGQFGPLNESARALKNDGATRTNRVGAVCIQIEVLARAGTPFTGYWKPGKNFRALMAAIRSWGVPDVWPMGALADHYGDPDAKRTREVWLTKGGHYGHCNIPGNDHWDPGAIDRAAFFKAAPRVVAKPPAPVIPPHAPAKPAKPSVSLRHIIAASKRDPGLPDGGTTFKADVLVIERALKAEGLLDGKYVDGSFGKRTQGAYREWQKRLGYRGTAADGIPGKVSLGKLGAKHGFIVKG